ncbi:MAG: AraC family transcriptional regulator [Candidatus Dactylopiibacterium carminicum]|uniref:AraC family transcriptional regulator n=2 Tax=Candidatus Dactylopiibacterium carminicum TaxID=857335 RepID=A0A272EUG9_9RHOO|nr:AraC family transcriptional regulator [Candidatus Dactylopiibacterium carminicum]PAS93749.1 MAG: AraC family transcriptional regulator [Candidatus Dactylopiibacterium carminicum]PAS98351.1 MAG: AraC family transcriptional regulator [Candidatus Dactylopiibacterium carminicum]
MARQWTGGTFFISLPAMSQHFWSDPALPFAESRRAQHSRACYRPHTHPTLSVGAVDQGHSRLTLGDAAPLALQAGDVVVIPAQRLHACNPAPDEAWSYQMLYLDEAWLRALQTEGLAEDPGLRLGGPTLRRSPACHRALVALNAVLFSPTAIEEKEGALIDFASVLLLETERPAETAPIWLEGCLGLLREQCAQPWRVAELAAHAGLSRYHFIRTFRTHTGMTPHAFQLDCRINHARTLLRQGCGIAETAYNLGFADQSHFQQAFKARVSATPGEYLRNRKTED